MKCKKIGNRRDTISYADELQNRPSQNAVVHPPPHDPSRIGSAWITGTLQAEALPMACQSRDATCFINAPTLTCSKFITALSTSHSLLVKQSNEYLTFSRVRWHIFSTRFLWGSGCGNFGQFEHYIKTRRLTRVAKSSCWPAGNGGAWVVSVWTSDISATRARDRELGWACTNIAPGFHAAGLE